ncbi:MAG: cysteine hydrolase [Rhodobacteraceae bacterium]|nr:cysteine hydrolase [Paracoccaceae bacterium]
MILYPLLAVILAFFLWLALGVNRIGRISKGVPIGPRDGTALLLIDLQTVFWRDGPYGDHTKARVEKTTTMLAARARDAGEPVIAVRQEWNEPATKLIAKITMQGKAIAGSAGTELAAPFKNMPTHVLSKGVQDAFQTGELDQLLKELDVGKIDICGLDGVYCVARTASAALNRGYSVTLHKDGIATSQDKKFNDILSGLETDGALIEDARGVSV